MRFLNGRRSKEQELDEEILAHLAIEAKQRIDAGETPEEAERGARHDFGNLGMVKEVTREMWGMAWLDSFAQDFKYALRVMRKTPGFTIVAILTLALGIGANTAIFSVVDAAMLRPLPFRDGDRLVRISATKDGKPIGGPSPMDMRDLAASAHSFDGMVTYDRWRKNVSGITGSEHAEETMVGLVPRTYFEILGLRPLLGRLFTDQEGVYGQHYVAAISTTFWRTRFAADPAVLGKTLRINGETYVIAAVMPDVIPGWMEKTSAAIPIWTPFASTTAWTEAARGDRGNYSLGRLKPGVSLEQARAELGALAARLALEHPADEGFGIDIQPLSDTRSGPIRPVLLMLSGAVGMVLLIACANLASLLIARNSARARELTVRTALGAGRWRLLRQLLLETLVLSLAGGAAGLVFASAAGEALARLSATGSVPYTSSSNALSQFWSATPEPRVLVFTLAISIFTAVLFGLVPAFTGTRVSIAATLREGGRGGTVGTAKQALRRMLVVAEVGLSLVLVVAASLLVQTMAHLQRQDAGFRADHLLISHIFIPPARYPSPDAITRFTETFGDRVRSIPGVIDASVTTGYPPSFQWKQVFTVPGLSISRLADAPTAEFAGVDSRYVRTLGLALVNGRDFSDTDTPKSLPVAVVNQEFVRRYFSGQEPVGRQIRPGPPPGVAAGPFADFGASSRNITVVGVVRNFVNEGMTLPPAPHIFTLYRQFPGLNFGFKDIVVRTETSPESIAPAVAQVLKSLDADIPLGEVQSMEAHISSQSSDTRFTTMLLGLFAVLGTVLAVIGIYGVVAYLVTQRTQEMGVRIALGASSMDILWLVLRYGLTLGLVGVGIGLFGAVVVGQSLAGLMYGVKVSDPVTLAAAGAGFILVTLMASAIPALRAMRIDPVRALRGE